MDDDDNLRLVPCEACQSEGRILRVGWYAWDEIDHGPCPECGGMGGVLVELEPVTEEEVMEPTQ